MAKKVNRSLRDIELSNLSIEVKSDVQSCKDDLGMNVHLLVETIASLGANFSVAGADLGMIGKSLVNCELFQSNYMNELIKSDSKFFIRRNEIKLLKEHRGLFIAFFITSSFLNTRYEVHDSTKAWLIHSFPNEFSRSEVTPNIVVAKDGTGVVETIREAIRHAPLVIPGLPKFQFVGENWQTTIIQGELYRIEKELSTLHTTTFTMKGPNFIGEELTILNMAGPDKHQVVALVVSAPEMAF
ncbi:pectinesterase 3-like [Quercus robur]|uniref:pectinesterase 3-like n=1 Tax=Quercus robur TaxID=38942 RepID=UPI002162D258|nr:pectinesterase 3-like [Quercus robur]